MAIKTNTINVSGVTIITSYDLDHVDGDKVYFVGGSICDIKTGKIKNKGNGFIAMTTIPQDDEEVVKIEKVFENANALILEETFGIVQIEVHTGNHIEVSVEGTESALSKMDFSRKDTTVKVKYGDPFATTFSSSSLSFANVSFSQLNMSNDGEIPYTLIKVPKGTKVRIEGTASTIVIGDTYGSLKLEVSGSCDLTAGKIASLTVDGSGSFTAAVEYVGGDVNVDVSGSSKVTIDDGKADNVTVDISGSGSFIYNGTTVDSDIDISGAGSVYIKHSTNEPSYDISGAGTVECGNWNLDDDDDDDDDDWDEDDEEDDWDLD